MDFAKRLGEVLNDSDTIPLDRLRSCSNSVEAIFLSPTPLKPEDLEFTTESACRDSAKLLLRSLIKRFGLVEPGDDSDDTELATFPSNALEALRCDDSWLQDTSVLVEGAEILRATKNLLRWYIQIYISVRPATIPSPLHVLQSFEVVEMYLTILQQSAGTDSPQRQELSRHACLALFYASYNPLPSNEAAQKLHDHLVESLDVLDVCTGILLRNNSAPVMLSVVRLLHNLLVSVQGFSKKVAKTTISAPTERAPWVRETETNPSKLLFWLLSWHVRPESGFPGTAADRSGDLVVEILRALYVLRAGNSLSEDWCRAIVLDVIRLPASDERAYNCALGGVTLLMDAPGDYGDYLVENDADQTLLNILQLQVSAVVSSSRSGNQVATAMVPSLVVLTKFATHSSDFRRRVKEFIFPPECEEEFWSKARAEVSRAKGQGVGAKNMKPLDAPKGSLRWKLIRLMTWTESHTKRTTSELLWTLCDKSAQEFVLRTGFGNAMPMLGIKGLVEMPSGFGT